jgi:diaminopimelate decarboxylase
LHHEVFDDVWISCPWNELDFEVFATQIQEAVTTKAVWISGLDLEVKWLAQVFEKQNRSILVPPQHALSAVAKPRMPEELSGVMRTPTVQALDCPDAEAEAFCRRFGWRVWIKGPYYEAFPVTSWRQLLSQREQLQSRWKSREVFLQQHVDGPEESIAFSAHDGNLLDAVHMVKRERTPEGKTWAGRIQPVNGNLLTALSDLVARVNWTGGGEIEFVRGNDGELWLLEVNPRFPAWIHGASLAGHNLPAQLVEASTGHTALPTQSLSKEFARVVVEIPTRDGIMLPVLPESSYMWGATSKHPSGMPVLAGRLAPSVPQLTDSGIERGTVPEVPKVLIDAANSLDGAKTPRRIYLQEHAEQTLRGAVSCSKRAGVNLAFSIKTNPDRRLLVEAKRCGFLAEAISWEEVFHATSCGFDESEIIFNGPAKVLKPWRATKPLRALFCDSVEEFEVVCKLASQMPLAHTVGIRIAPLGVNSRFGVDLSTADSLARVARLFGELPKTVKRGVHFHMPSSLIGIDRWGQCFEAVLAWAGAIQALSNMPISAVDIGGGWHQEDWRDVFSLQLPAIATRIRSVLGSVHEIVAEPGKAMCESSFALLMRVVAKRNYAEKCDLVVDGSIAELPLARSKAHTFLHFSSSGPRFLKSGTGLVLGRLCMEDDVLAQGMDLSQVAEGDVLGVLDCGAYDTSMAYSFGRGTRDE